MEARLCLHCGQPAGAPGLPDFCCSGCATVYRILKSGPFADYYRMKQEGVCFEKSSPASPGLRDYSFWNQSDSNPLKIYVEGIHCTACVWLLERLALALPADVESSMIDLSRSILTVLPKADADRARIASTIASLGYRPHLIQSEGGAARLLERENRKRLIDLGVAGALSGNVMLMSIPLYSGVEGGFRQVFEWLSLILSIPSIFYSGRSFFQNVASGLRNRIFPIDGPILLAILVAFFYSAHSVWAGTRDLYFDSLTALVFLLLASRYLLSRIRQSSALNPGILNVFHPPFRGAVGDLIRLFPGDRIPVDGKIVSGGAWVDQSHFTGESRAVLQKAGDPVYAGSLVVEADQGLVIRVEKTGADTRLERFLQRLQEASRKRTVFERTTEAWASRLLALVLFIAAVAIVFFQLTGFGHEGLRRVLAFLIVTCPCALALATPLVYSLASENLLSKGILLKEPEALDAVLPVRDLFFDKTGTLTYGDLRLEKNAFDGLKGREKAILLALSGRSNHPASRSIYRELHGLHPDLEAAALDSWVEIHGRGVQGESGGLVFGLRKHPDPSRLGVQFFETRNGVDRELAGFVFTDRLREDVPALLKKLVSEGYDLHLLTGDHADSARSVMKDLPIRIHADLSPLEKAEFVQKGMMVGDGVNDSLALVRARVGIAVQGGMEAAIESAGVYSLKPGLQSVPVFLATARKTRSVLVSNFAISTAFNALGATLALSGHMSPLLAAVLMPMSATTVFVNSRIRMREGSK
jgi:cation transport ATPase